MSEREPRDAASVARLRIALERTGAAPGQAGSPVMPPSEADLPLS
jgi:hypothetical protein